MLHSTIATIIYKVPGVVIYHGLADFIALAWGDSIDVLLQTRYFRLESRVIYARDKWYIEVF